MDDLSRTIEPLQPTRKRYEPPAVEKSGDFERLVLACGHTPEMGADGDEACMGLNASS